MNHPFSINFLDHVAIYVADMDRSIAWYEKVVGLKKVQLKEWGTVPTFMLSGKTGIAIFPAEYLERSSSNSFKFVKIDHFAFNVSNEDFEKAKLYFESMDIKYQFQDHHYFHSIYLKDPDQHKVELTTLVVNEEDLI